MNHNAFGEDTSPVSYKFVADQVRAMKPNNMTADNADDVLTLMEYMRDQLLAEHDIQIKRADELERREAEVAVRERNVAIRLRVAEVAAKVTPKKARRWW